MPYVKRRTYRKRTTTTYHKKRGGRKRYYRKRFTANRPTLGSGFPASKFVRLRYCDTIQMSAAAAGTIDIHNYAANALYDTDITSTGHQPLGFDQWAAIYNHYTVVGSKLTARVVAASVNNNLAPVVVAIKITDDGVPPTSMTGIMEQGMSSYRLFNAQANSNPGVIRKNFSLRKFFGIKDVKDVRTRYGATVGSNPDDLAYFTICVGTAGGVTMSDAKTVTVDLTLDFIVQFTEPKDLPQS